MSGDFFPLQNERTSECLFLPLLVPCPVSIFLKWHWRNSHINRSTASGNLKAVRVHLCWFMSRLIEKLLYVEDHHFVVFFSNALKKWYRSCLMSLFDIEIYWYSRISSANIAHLSNWTTLNNLNNQCAVWFCLGTIVPADDASNAYDIENFAMTQMRSY